MDGISWGAFVPAALLVSLVPGANQVLSIQHGAKYGIRSALSGLIGRFSAFLVLACCAALGMSSILLRSSTAFMIVKWVGIAYLAWLGISTLRTAGQSASPHLEDEHTSAHPVRTEALTAMTNPKALLLFAVFVPQFVADPGGWNLLIAGVAYIAIEASTASLYIVLGQWIGKYLTNVRSRKGLDQASAVAYLGMAGWLALERNP
ncbi:LysE family translocator [Dermacoccus nishinomiyaensis]|uniref:LysE family translocator n=1 Tax=Dermacoccus nishinomiyaensis TaxID=1274 RepID=UPI001EF6007E|nr:LysE family translocator [Dermacoccus nishinomiyaensis]MCG7430797.1 LysE family translocator [Dermacoccus nishinomiyaensis]